MFDYFFPGIMPGTAADIPDEVTIITGANWEATAAEIRAALDAEPANTRHLVAVMDLPHDAGDPETVREATTQILRYSFMGTNDATSVLGGNPFGNRETLYAGSDDDEALNAGVARHDAEASALASIAADFQTTGQLRAPLVAMHTTRDPVTPIWHTDLYQTMSTAAGGETDANLITSASVFPDLEMQKEFLDLSWRTGSRPIVIEPLPDRFQRR